MATLFIQVRRAYWTAQGHEAPEGGPTVAEHEEAATMQALAAVFELVERDYDVLPIPAEAVAPEQEEICGAVYVDPDRPDRRVEPCGKTLGHENGPSTDWKRGYHSNGMFKWPVAS
jgi:hypothetical protein